MQQFHLFNSCTKWKKGFIRIFWEIFESVLTTHDNMASDGSHKNVKLFKSYFYLHFVSVDNMIGMLYHHSLHHFFSLLVPIHFSALLSWIHIQLSDTCIYDEVITLLLLAIHVKCVIIYVIASWYDMCLCIIDCSFRFWLKDIIGWQGAWISIKLLPLPHQFNSNYK